MTLAPLVSWWLDSKFGFLSFIGEVLALHLYQIQFRSSKNLIWLYVGGVSCTLELLRAYPILKKAYGDSTSKVLHVGPDTCSVVSKLLKEEATEAWGIEPYDLEDADANCKSLVSKGIVRAADIKFRLPYRAKSFSLVIVSDAVDYLSPKYINKTLPELARVAADGLVVLSGKYFANSCLYSRSLEHN